MEEPFDFLFFFIFLFTCGIYIDIEKVDIAAELEVEEVCTSPEAEVDIEEVVKVSRTALIGKKILRFLFNCLRLLTP